jgi:16S rRNA (guanine966-N2)-methyltransferase
VRIIAGRLGGRKIAAPAGLETRPTSDRVREALFSRLGYVTNASVLDLYAGTGALGIEAISRGAARAVFVESARPALTALRANLTVLGLTDAARVLAQPIARALPLLRSLGPFNLVFVDPPYAALADVPPFLVALIEAGGLTPDARVVIEHAAKDTAPSMAGLAGGADTRVYGTTAVTLYHRGEG